MMYAMLREEVGMADVSLETVLEQARQLSSADRERLLEALERDRRYVCLGKLIEEWRNDASGYEDEAWPELQAALDRTREELGMRKLFDV
jgi:hypothetical protein